jgi:hypothetical protein
MDLTVLNLALPACSPPRSPLRSCCGKCGPRDGAGRHCEDEVEFPSMGIKLKRRVAMLAVALLAFAQASVAFSSCSMDRGTMSPVMAADKGEPGADCETPMTARSPQNANLCALHCTWDLQVAGIAVALLRSPADLPILTVALPHAAPAARTGLHAPPEGAPPHRILLHSFLI